MLFWLCYDVNMAYISIIDDRYSKGGARSKKLGLILFSLFFIPIVVGIFAGVSSLFKNYIVNIISAFVGLFLAVAVCVWLGRGISEKQKNNGAVIMQKEIKDETLRIIGLLLAKSGGHITISEGKVHIKAKSRGSIFYAPVSGGHLLEEVKCNFVRVYTESLRHISVEEMHAVEEALGLSGEDVIIWMYGERRDCLARGKAISEDTLKVKFSFARYESFRNFRELEKNDAGEFVIRILGDYY